MSEYEAKRRHPRHPVRLPVLYKVADRASAKAGVGWTRDLSEGGACLELAESLEPLTPLQLVLRTTKGGLELAAEVVWAGKPGPAGPAIFHGVAFTELTDGKRQALRDLFVVQKAHARLEGLRIPMELAVSCRPKGMADPVLLGRTGDISRGGLLLLLPEVIPPDFALQITLETIRGNVEAEGVIAWVELSEKKKSGELIRHGLRFTDISWPNQTTLCLLLAEMP